MADTSVSINPGTVTPIETRSTPSGAQQQVLVLGVPDQNSVVPTTQQDGVLVHQNISTSSTVSSVVGSAASVQLLPSNSNRKGVTIYNDSTAILYVALTATAASTSAYSVQIASQGYYELAGPPFWTGQINGIWSSATGNARITELA